MWTKSPIFSLESLYATSNPEKVIGKVNHPKSSNNQAGERIKTNYGSRELVETLVDQTSGLIPIIRVGQTVISLRQSEHTEQSRVSLDT